MLLKSSYSWTFMSPRLLALATFTWFYLNISFSTEQLASDLRNPEAELNSEVELVVRTFEDES